MYKQSPRLVKVSGDAHRRILREGDSCRKDIYIYIYYWICILWEYIKLGDDSLQN